SPGMTMITTSTVAMSIQAVSPLSSLAASCAAAGPANARASAAVSAAASGKRMAVISVSVSGCRLKSGRIGLAGADADYLLEVEHEDLPVADLSGIGGSLDGLDRLLEELRPDGGLDLHFGEEIDDVLGAPIELGVAFLPPEALHLGHRDALHADARERLAHLVELERLDDCTDQVHGASAQNVFCRKTT